MLATLSYIRNQESLYRESFSETVATLMTISTLSPIDQSVVVERIETTSNEIEEVFRKSLQAFQSYSKNVSLEERLAIASRFLDLLTQNSDVLSKEITIQMGRPLRYTPIEIRTAVMRGRYMIGVAKEQLKDVPGDQSQESIRRFLKKVPIGPCYIIGA